MLTYTYRYNRVIKWFKDHPVSKESCQCENHHIVPRSCGGLDNAENLVLLPLRWHYIVHCWLPAVYLEQGKQKEYEKMLFAWNRFQNYRKTFRDGLQTVKEDSLLYQKLRQEYLSLVSSTIGQKIEGKRNGRYNTHWWKDPNDKTKSLSIKEGDPVPAGWIRGKWQNYKNAKCIVNDKTGKHKYIAQEEQIPNGWHISQRKIFKCKFCGAIKEKSKTLKTISNCKEPNLCWHFQPTKKLIKYFGFDETKLGTEQYYEEYRNSAKYFFKLWNSLEIKDLASKIKWQNKSYAGLFSLYFALSKIFPEFRNII